jgi:NhaP-type Na+/H+ or K+/H+ antiporter
VDQKLIAPVLIGAFALWLVYRRVLRNIGRQPVNARRMQTRIALLAVIGVLIASGTMHDLELLGALLAGMAGGAALGLLSLRNTKFEVTPESNFYTPHTYIGLIVPALLLSRIANRLLAVYPAAQADGNPFAAYQKSPLTLGILGVVVAYYMLYYAGVLSKSKGLRAATDGM